MAAIRGGIQAMSDKKERARAALAGLAMVLEVLSRIVED
jgi:hypothetical protein